MSLGKAVSGVVKETGLRIKILKQIDEYSGIVECIFGKLFFYNAKYIFKQLNETNIPVSLYKKIPKDIHKIFVFYKGKAYLIKKDSIQKKVRINRKLKIAVYPIPASLLIPFKIKSSFKESDSKFIHLHVHSDHSLGDGVSQCKVYLEKAKELGMSAVAITDHGNMSAHMDLQLRAKKLGVKPIFGAEFYIIEDASLHDGDHRSSNHIVLLAKDDIGYRNLLKLQKLSWSTENFYYRPRIDFAMLEKHRKGLVVLTACLKGLIAKEVFYGSLREAYKVAKWLKKLFANDLYLELQLHNILELDSEDNSYMDIQRVYNMALITIAKKLDIKTVITNDVHYVDKGMHEVQSKVIKMRQEFDLREAYCNSIWFKSYEEIKETWEDNCSYIPESVFIKSIKATTEVADKCNFEIPTGGLRIPKIDITRFPKYKTGQTDKDYLKMRITMGLHKKRKTHALSTNINIYLNRIETEMDAFIKTDVISYILIYDDLVRFLKRKGCLCSLRGSANGSVVLWLIGLSIVDPIKFNILFERFISPARIEAHMADIDIDLDISHVYRDIAINYLKERYGEDHICSVGSFGRMQLRAAIKNMARVEAFIIKKKMDEAESEKLREKLERKLEPFSYQEINKITKALTLTDTIEEVTDKPEVETWYKANKKWFDKFVKSILGNAYSESLHPAGVIVSPEPYDEWLPVRSNKLSKEKGGGRVFATQWENSHTYEEFLNERGVMVMDVLGLKNLTIIDDTVKLIKERHNKELSLDTIPLDCKEVYKTLANGENIGFFQLGKESLKSLFRNIKPDNIEDLIFMIASDRPGPIASGAFEHYTRRKHGEEKVEVLHPSLKPILEDTLGVFTYSEHVMLIATRGAGLSPIESEKMRKIIKSKDINEFSEFKEKFINGFVKRWAKVKHD